MNSRSSIAHVRESDHVEQTLQKHLEGVACSSRQAASKLGLTLAGELIGLLHDLGKYSDEFQAYIRSATGLLNPDEDDDYVDAKQKKGRVDHSTAGAQQIWRELSKHGLVGQIVGQILGLCVASHHSGLIDCLSTNQAHGVQDNFSRRMGKEELRSHVEESLSKADEAIRSRTASLLGDKTILDSIRGLLLRIAKASPEASDKGQVAQFQIGLLVRFLFSCLIDADRQDTADFERPRAAKARQDGAYLDWGTLVERLDLYLSTFAIRHPIDRIRRDISRHCLDASSREQGLFTLTVPTGGGKTLASLRFALHHARAHQLDRVVYVVPFTSIIDQNADAVRKILEPENRPQDTGRVVLEHHSNLGPTRQGWKNKLLSENWDAPVVFTTSVQFLEALFGGGTRGARRMHQLARAVIVFDEIQTLPVKCVHLFNNAVNFLADYCGSTIVLCTATQPLLAHVQKTKGAAKLSPNSEIMPDVQRLFDQLQRVQVEDRRRPGGWSEEDLVSLALSQSERAGSCLIVVNTKKAAKGLYRKLEPSGVAQLYHLSTSMCAAHRRASLREIRKRLDAWHRGEDGQPIVCVSTQLIEAGVDVDFGSVIRFAAGLDSVAQAAGRCNRNGAREKGVVHVVNPADESLAHLKDIEVGKQKAERVFDDFREDPQRFGDDILGPAAMKWFYENYFFARQSEMDYPVGADSIGRHDTLLNMLSVNRWATGDYQRRHAGVPPMYLRQSFMAANKEFQAIDAPTHGVIVPYGDEGRKIIVDLCAAFEVEKQFKLLHAAQQFTVNVFPHEIKALTDAGALSEVQKGTGIHYLNESYYSPHFGLSTERVSEQEFLYVE
jgi:CRISPR-associated endonuclease/helicase Cas3